MAKRKKESVDKSKKSVVLFEEHTVRRVWNEKDEKWYFSIADVVGVLADSQDPQGYVKDMRRRDPELSKGWGQIATPLYIKTSGGRQKVNCASVEGTLRIIQSIPSKKAEPFKLWLAKVGYERLQETVDPEQAVIRARENWQQLGRSDKWITQRMRGQETRQRLTDYWSEHGVKEGIEYAKLTDVIHQQWAEVTTLQHKKLKNLGKQNLRDHMTEAELIFTALAELSTAQIAQVEKAEGFGPNKVVAKKGGSIAKNARLELERQTGRPVISADNFLPPDGKSKRKLLK